MIIFTAVVVFVLVAFAYTKRFRKIKKGSPVAIDDNGVFTHADNTPYAPIGVAENVDGELVTLVGPKGRREFINVSDVHRFDRVWWLRK